MTAIRFYREKAGFTQSKLADAIGVSQSTVAMWESGDRKPDIITLKKIASILRCTADDLLETISTNE
ncbi:MAG: helix-turn-helix transcriptional regulator [Oscillospiraceae bacterium]